MKADKLDGKESELFPYELAEKYRKACVSPSSPQAAQMAKHVVQLLKALVVPLQKILAADARIEDEVRKRHFDHSFPYRKLTICQDRLGTNIGKTQKRMAFRIGRRPPDLM
eukprot:COSAG06_NODE_1228_length_10179_cov_3.735119_11_plen_111_part_00